MWNAYLRLDGWIISTLQEAYLWLLDRTGVYVATVSFTIYAACCIVEVAFIDGLSPWIWGAFLMFVGISSGHKYLLQDKGKNDQINYAAMMMEGMWIRRALDAMFFFLLFVSLVAMDPARVVAMIGFIIFQYLFLIKVRDRDKKPFFETKRELAMGGNSQ